MLFRLLKVDKLTEKLFTRKLDTELRPVLKKSGIVSVKKEKLHKKMEWLVPQMVQLILLAGREHLLLI